MNEKFDEIIGRLVAQEPVLEDGEALTERIMADIDFDVDIDRLTQTVPAKKSTSKSKSRSKAGSTSTSRLFLRTFTSAAAVLLIIIYLWNSFDENQSMSTSKSMSKSTSPNYEQCIAKYKSDYSFLEEATDLREAGARYLAKKKSHESVINYLKNKHYEVH